MIDMCCFVPLVVGVVLLGIGGFLVWVFFIAAAGTAAKEAMRAAEIELNNLLPDIQKMLGAAADAYNDLTPHQKKQISDKLIQVSRQMNQLNNLSRQRYDLRVSELQGMAANAGIDWTPGSY